MRACIPWACELRVLTCPHISCAAHGISNAAIDCPGNYYNYYGKVNDNTLSTVMYAAYY